ncbi:MAG: hypothetical protein CL607_11845 [Anaerolineaceae bacterium]|nr:hypothetical protein [Anaerolineaceae bacterium]
MNIILAAIGALYLIFPTGGLVEFLPDYIPFAGHLDEMLASYTIARFMGLTNDPENKSALRTVIIVALGAAGLIYLIFPTLGVVEFVPDALPFVGNLDEMLASLFMFAAGNRIDKLVFSSGKTSSAALPALNSESMQAMPQNPIPASDNDVDHDATNPTPPASIPARIKAASVRASDAPPPPPSNPPMAAAPVQEPANAPQANRPQPVQSQPSGSSGGTSGGQPPRRGLTCQILAAGFVGILLLILITFLGVPNQISAAITNLAAGVNLPGAASVQVQDVIVSQFRTRSTLNVAEVKINIPNLRVNYAGGLLNASGFGASYAAFGEVQIGVNLQQDVEVTPIDASTYQITLPQPYITSCSLTPLIEWDRSTSISADWDAAEDAAYITAMRELVRKAVDDGYIEDAEYQAELALNDILRDLTYTITNQSIDFNYVFAESDQVVIDDSCEPPEHLKWTFCETAQGGIWRESKVGEDVCAST